MKVLFRLDASNSVGAGHFIRCAAIAAELRSRNHEAIICSRTLSPRYVELARQASTPVHILPLPLSASKEEDARATVGLANELLAPGDWVLADSYEVDTAWITEARRTCVNIAIINDRSLDSFDADVSFHPIMVDPNIGLSLGTMSRRGHRYIGIDFVPLRAEFFELSKRISRPLRPTVSRVVVFAGAGASHDLVAKILNALHPSEHQDIHFDVIAGVDYESEPSSEQISNVTFHRQPVPIGNLLYSADLYVGSGGTITWERAVLGLPGIVFAVAHNQIAQSAELANKGIQVYLGGIESALDILGNAFRGALVSGALLSWQSTQLMTLVDGRGAGRIVGGLLGHGIKVRRAEYVDLERLYEWRNHPVNRRGSKSSVQIPFDAHIKWFGQMLSDPTKLLLIGSLKEGDVGVVRFDTDGDRATISIYLVPGMHGRSLGQPLLEAAMRFYTEQNPATVEFRATVTAHNSPSNQMFQRMGFRMATTTYSYSLE